MGDELDLRGKLGNQSKDATSKGGATSTDLRAQLKQRTSSDAADESAAASPPASTKKGGRGGGRGGGGANDLRSKRKKGPGKPGRGRG